MQHRILLIALVSAAVTLPMLSTYSANAQSLKPCSYTAINGSCTLTIDRPNPVAPPTIYVRHGEKVTVKVSSPLPIEHLTMDLKSAAEQVPQDQFANGFSALTGVLGGIQLISPKAEPRLASDAKETEGGVAELSEIVAPPECKSVGIPCPPSAADLTKWQQNLGDEMDIAVNSKNGTFTLWVMKALCMVHTLFQPVASTAVSADPAAASPDSCKLYQEKVSASTTAAKIKPAPLPPAPKTGDELVKWQERFNDQSQSALDSLKIDDYKTKLGNLDADIADAADKKKIRAGQLTTITANEKQLQAKLDAFTLLKQKLIELKEQVLNLSIADERTTFVISDLHSTDKNNIVQTWDLNAANKVTTIAGQVKADKLPDNTGALLGTLTDVPTKQVVAEFTIQFMNQPRFEISSGLLVPFKPYHTYSVGLPQSIANAPPATPPNCPPNDCPVVMQSLSNAIVPDVSVNFLPFYEWAPHQQRLAFMATLAVGYNTATTSAALGFGPSIAWKSIVISPLVVTSRDQKLTGGYVLGQSAGTATIPMTTNVWTFIPSIGVSLRIPLTGASK